MRHVTLRGKLSLDANLFAPESATALFAAVMENMRRALTGITLAGLTMLAPVNASAAPAPALKAPLLPAAAIQRDLNAVNLNNTLKQIFEVATCNVQSELVAGAPLFDLTYADFQSTLAAAPASDQASLTAQFLTALGAITPDDVFPNLPDDHDPARQSVRDRAAVLTYAGLVSVLGAPQDYRQMTVIANGMGYAGEITRTLQAAVPKLNTDPNRLALIAANLTLHEYLLQALTESHDDQGIPLSQPSAKTLRHLTQIALVEMNMAYTRATPLPAPTANADADGPFDVMSPASNTKPPPWHKTVQSSISTASTRSANRDEAPDDFNNIAMNFFN